MRTIFTGLTLTAAMLVAATPSFAQDSSTQPEDDGDVILSIGRAPQTIIVTGAPQTIDELGNSVTRISGDTLVTQQTVSVSEALARLPGVTQTRNGPLGGFTGVRIRGADASQTLVVINGIRVNDPTSPGGGFDFGNLFAGNIQSIDVQRGSNSVTWGSDAIGGVVLVETGGRNGFAAEYGTHNTSRLNGQWSIADRGYALSAGGGFIDTDGISAARGGSEADGFRQYSANVHGGVDVTNAFRLSATAIYARSRLDLDGFAPPTFSFGDTDEFQRTEEFYAGVIAAHDIGNFSHNLTFTYADIDRDSFDPAAGPAPSFAARGRNSRIAWQGRYRTDSLDLVGGADHEWSRSRTASAFSSDRGRTAISGVYGNATLRPTDIMRIGIGARHDNHRQFGGNTVVSANMRFDITQSLSAQASYAEGFKAPTLFQLSGTAGGFGNPALQPERSQGGDIGLLFDNGSHYVRATLFRRDSVDLIDFVGCTGPISPAICGGGTRPFGTYVNIARARAEGLELEMRLRPTDELTLSGAYSYIDTRDRSFARANSGNRLARRPLHSGTVSMDYDAGGFSIGGDIQLVGDSFDDAGNFTRLDGYALVGLRTSVGIGRSIELYGRVENLFDTGYQNVAGYNTYGRTVSVGVRARL